MSHLNQSHNTIPKTGIGQTAKRGTSGFGSQSVSYDPVHLDAFGRLRISTPLTLFDSKQIHDNDPNYYDDSEVSGSGTSSTYTKNKASTEIAVSANTAGKRVRQTKFRFNYQPGKGHLILATGVMKNEGAGIRKEIAYGDDFDAIGFACVNGVHGVFLRTTVTGTTEETFIPQSEWNIDRLNGDPVVNFSGITLDFEKTQIFFMDMEWLGAGDVRFGVVVNDTPVYCHQIHNANTNPNPVYMRTPNLPVRYSIENDGTGAAASLTHICSSVISEGGREDFGYTRYESTGETDIQANSSGSIYVVCGIRLKAANLDAAIKITNISMMNDTPDDYEWLLLLNPTLDSAVTFNDTNTGSTVQFATGEASNPSLSTVSDPGTKITGGYIKSGGNVGAVSRDLETIQILGSLIDGTRDEVYLCVRPLANGANIYGALEWKEFS